MAGTMLDNMNGRLTLMQSAADGLKIAIGEDLTPAMSGLYDVGAEVLGWMQGVVEENPGLVRGIAAGTVTLGGLLGVLTAVAAASRLRKWPQRFSRAPCRLGWTSRHCSRRNGRRGDGGNCSSNILR